MLFVVQKYLEFENMDFKHISENAKNQYLNKYAFKRKKRRAEHAWCITLYFKMLLKIYA